MRAKFHPRNSLQTKIKSIEEEVMIFCLCRSPLPFFLALALLCSPSTSRPMVVDNPFLTIAIDRFVVGFILILSAVVVDWSLDKIDGWMDGRMFLIFMLIIARHNVVFCNCPISKTT